MDGFPHDPWSYASPEGYLAEDGKVRVYGFRLPPVQPVTQPRCASRQPVNLHLEPGRYAWCACGYSSTQPMCDRSHCTGAPPNTRRAYEFKVVEACELLLCRCKQTCRPPFCDGAHICKGPLPAPPESGNGK